MQGDCFIFFLLALLQVCRYVGMLVGACMREYVLRIRGRVDGLGWAGEGGR